MLASFSFSILSSPAFFVIPAIPFCHSSEGWNLYNKFWIPALKLAGWDDISGPLLVVLSFPPRIEYGVNSGGNPGKKAFGYWNLFIDWRIVSWLLIIIFPYFLILNSPLFPFKSYLLLLTSYFLLLTAYCLFLTAYCLLLNSYFLLSIFHDSSLFTNSWATNLRA